MIDDIPYTPATSPQADEQKEQPKEVSEPASVPSERAANITSDQLDRALTIQLIMRRKMALGDKNCEVTEEEIRQEATNSKLVALNAENAKLTRERDEALVQLRAELDALHSAANETAEQDAEECALCKQLSSELATLRAAMAVKDAALHEIDCLTEGNVDGSPDCSNHSALCNVIQCELRALSNTPANDLLARIEDAAKALEVASSWCPNCDGRGQDDDGEVWVNEECPKCKPILVALAGLQPWRPKA